MKQRVIEQLEALFVTYSDRYKIHELAGKIIESASRDTEFLFDIIRSNISDPLFLAKDRHYPTLSMPIHENPQFSFVLNIFPPLPSRRTDISFQSIHHHGDLLLTSVGAFGPGYNSLLFKKGFKIDRSTFVTNLEVQKDYLNCLSKAEFIDSYQPHIVFYPAEFSATFAFWCSSKTTAKESLKKVPFVNYLKKPASRMATKFGLDKLLGINKVEYFDFYIEGNDVLALKDRLAYDERGNNENFLQNVFSFIQRTGFKDLKFLNSLILKENISITAKKFIDMLLNDIPIPDIFYKGHLDIEKVNIEKSDIIQILT